MLIIICTSGAQNHLQIYTTPPNKDQRRLTSGLCGAHLGLILGGEGIAGGNIGLYMSVDMVLANHQKFKPWLTRGWALAYGFDGHGANAAFRRRASWCRSNTRTAQELPESHQRHTSHLIAGGDCLGLACRRRNRHPWPDDHAALHSSVGLPQRHSMSPRWDTDSTRDTLAWLSFEQSSEAHDTTGNVF